MVLAVVVMIILILPFFSNCRQNTVAVKARSEASELAVTSTNSYGEYCVVCSIHTQACLVIFNPYGLEGIERD
jgi:hypothetical protein